MSSCIETFKIILSEDTCEIWNIYEYVYMYIYIVFKYVFVYTHTYVCIYTHIVVQYQFT